MDKGDQTDRSLREHVLYVLRGGGAHIDFESTVTDFPTDKINDRVQLIPYSPWQVLEHMRIAQSDILEFSRDAKHVSPPWPDGYWPDGEKPAHQSDWQQSVDRFLRDRKELESLVEDSNTDLLSPIAHGSGQTILRQALLAADHNAYHLGVLVTLKRLLA
jgi:hypothetical protein